MIVLLVGVFVVVEVLVAGFSDAHELQLSRFTREFVP